MRERERRAVPDEGDLLLIHPRLELNAGILSEGWDDEAEHQSDADEHGRKNDLQGGEEVRNPSEYV